MFSSYSSAFDYLKQTILLFSPPIKLWKVHQNILSGNSRKVEWEEVRFG